MPTKVVLRETKEGVLTDLYTCYINQDFDFNTFKLNKKEYLQRMLFLRRIVLALRQFEVAQNISLLDPYICEWHFLDNQDAVQIVFEHKGIVKILETTLPTLAEESPSQIYFADERYILSQYIHIKEHNIEKTMPESEHRITVSHAPDFKEVNASVLESARRRKLPEKYLAINTFKKARNKLVALRLPLLKKIANSDKQKPIIEFEHDLLTPLKTNHQLLKELLGNKTQLMESKVNEDIKTYRSHQASTLELDIRDQWNVLIAKYQPLQNAIGVYITELAELNIELSQLVNAANEELVKLQQIISPTDAPNLILALQSVAFEYYKHLLNKKNSIPDSVIKQFNEKFADIAKIQHGAHIETHLELSDLSSFSLQHLSQLTNKLMATCYANSSYASYADSLKIISDNLNYFLKPVPPFTVKIIYELKKQKIDINFTSSPENHEDITSEDYKNRLSAMAKKISALKASVDLKNAEEIDFLERIQDLEAEAAVILYKTKEISDKIHRKQGSRRSSLQAHEKFLPAFKSQLSEQENAITELNKFHIKNHVHPSRLNVDQVLEASKKECEPLYHEMEKAIILQNDRIDHMNQKIHIDETSLGLNSVKTLEADLLKILNTLTLAVADFRKAGKDDIALFKAAVAERAKLNAEREAEAARIQALADAEAARLQALADAAAAQAAEEQAAQNAINAENIRQSKAIETVNSIISTLKNVEGWNNQVHYHGGKDANGKKVPQGIADMYKLLPAGKISNYQVAADILLKLKAIADEAIIRGGSRYWFFTVRDNTTTLMYKLIKDLLPAQEITAEVANGVTLGLGTINKKLNPPELTEEQQKKILTACLLRSMQ